MSKKEQTQKMPNGLEIPVPTRKTVDDALARSAEPAKPSSRRKRGTRKK